MDTLSARISELSWFHSIDLGGGVITPGYKPHHVLKKEAEALFTDPLEGLTVLDVGAFDGYFSFEAKRRGASRVLATDHHVWSASESGTKATFDLANEQLNLGVESLDLDVADLSPGNVGPFDVVLFLGVFYHLKSPFTALETISRLARKRLILETHLAAHDVTRPAMIFYPGEELNHDHSNWWGPNRACVEAMMRWCGFARVEYAPHPVYGVGRGIFRGYRE